MNSYKYSLLFHSIFIAFIALTPSTPQLCAQNRALDEANWHPKQFDHKTQREYKGVSHSSLYLTMRDSVKIAVDIYLPKGLEKGKKIPAILFQTRYWRGLKLAWPLDGLKIVPHPANVPMKEFVLHGYALVSVDVRGTGASGGAKKQALPDLDEVKDGGEVMDWIVKQDWSDGIIGAMGISYIGNTALYQMYNQHPNLRAVVPMCSIFDAYDDVGMPGGIFAEKLMGEWNGFCETMDCNELPGKRGELIVKGVRPVNSSPKESLSKALESHSCNFYQTCDSSLVEFTDDSLTLDGRLRKIDILSPHLFLDRINSNPVPVYAYSGWFDLAFQHGAIRQFLNFRFPNNKLILGPWMHSCNFSMDPNGFGDSKFDHFGEILRFMDRYLKGKRNGIEKEPAVHYYVMNKSQWKSAEEWPPKGGRKVSLHLATPSRLFFIPPIKNAFSYSSLQVDSTLGSNPGHRWHLGKPAKLNSYPDYKNLDDRLLTFSSLPLQDGMEITGHPVVELYMTSTTNDGAIYCYLEEVTASGEVRRITEGQLRLLHRKSFNNGPEYEDVVPYRSYKRTDSQEMVPGKIEKVVFDLLPTSYYFPEGSSIQIAISGADVDRFKYIPEGQCPTYQIFHSEKYPSKLSFEVY